MPDPHVTIPDEDPIVQYTVGGTPDDTFTIPFSFFSDGSDDPTDILVYDGANLIPDTDYTVTGNAGTSGGFEGGDVVLDTPVSNTTITVLREVPAERTTDFPLSGPFNIAALNTQLDKNFAILQQQNRKINRRISIPDSDDPDITTELPAAATRALKVQTFDEDGNVDVSTLTIEEIEEGSVDAAASAAAAAASAAAAATAETNAETAETNAESAASAAAASATAAQTAASSMMWQDVVFLTSADSPYTITLDDSGKLYAVDCTSGAVTINLPGISTLNLTVPWSIGIKKTDSSGNSITVARNGTDTIDGGTSKTIGTADSGAVFIPDTGPSPDEWTTAEFGATAGNMVVDRFSGTGAQTAFTLSVAPGSENNTWVSVSGVLQHKDTYSVSGTTLTFSSAPASGTDNIEVVIGTTLSVGTPSDSTVTAAKLADQVFNALTTVTAVAADHVSIADASDSGNKKKALISDILTLALFSRKVGNFTFDMTTATGTIPITGVGFQPRLLILFQAINASAASSFGFGDGTTQFHIAQNDGGTADNWTTGTTLIGQAIVSSGNQQQFALNSLDADGFTLGNTKAGTPTGTARFGYIALR